MEEENFTNVLLLRVDWYILTPEETGEVHRRLTEGLKEWNAKKKAEEDKDRRIIELEAENARLRAGGDSEELARLRARVAELEAGVFVERGVGMAIGARIERQKIGSVRRHRQFAGPESKPKPEESGGSPHKLSK